MSVETTTYSPAHIFWPLTDRSVLAFLTSGGGHREEPQQLLDGTAGQLVVAQDRQLLGVRQQGEDTEPDHAG
ncbi:hypothetical protein [Streptomyces achromogenes]|uniref:hypothetical protein n=1 Tax=Streptomyces achromogenes TaxID=67255 RepID=UPI0036B3CF6B